SSTPYRTFNVCADMAYLMKKNGSHLGVGLNVFSDKAGDGLMGTTMGTLHLSGVLAADDKNLISVGLYGGFGQRSLSSDKLYWDKQYDGMTFDASRPTFEPTTSANFTYADFGAGVAWFYGKGHSTLSSNNGKTFSAGFSLQHLNQPVYSFYGAKDERLPMKFVAHGNAEIGLTNRNLILEPSYLVMIQGGHHEINAGMLFKYIMQDASVYTGRKKPGAFILGGYYRLGDAAVIATGYEYSGFRIGMSYDVNLSDLKTATKARGGFEVSLRFVNAFGNMGSTKSFD
ncbi:MAG TPA: PorP/SprF family type IX secretion system membrane protein, partial [Bacteroidia bacterium]|nr:PorP/SprF family type IX secretion system membrane protein [Bacteroidia bacterium]